MQFQTQTYKLPAAARQAILADSKKAKQDARIEIERQRFVELNAGCNEFGKPLAEKKESSKIST